MKRRTECSICGNLRLEPAGTGDYKWLYRYHYRTAQTGPIAGAWVLRPVENRPYSLNYPVGLIIYGMPAANLAPRTRGCGEFPGSSRSERLGELNRRMRTIRRVIIDPRYRGLGLAARLVRRTLGLIGTEFVEAYTVMGNVTGFFEKAGMTAMQCPERIETLRLGDTLIRVGIPENLWWDSQIVYEKIRRLPDREQERLETQIVAFLKPYKNRRSMPPGPERIRFVLSRLAGRPVYYFWQNPQIARVQEKLAA